MNTEHQNQNYCDLCVQRVWNCNKNGTGEMTTAKNEVSSFYWVITWKLLFS